VTTDTLTLARLLRCSLRDAWCLLRILSAAGLAAKVDYAPRTTSGRPALLWEVPTAFTMNLATGEVREVSASILGDSRPNNTTSVH